MHRVEPGEPADSGEATGTPLSFAQQRLWFLEQLTPGATTYYSPFGLRLTGPVDVTALRSALGEIVRRHESLRTSFVVVNDEPRQVVRPHGPFDLRVIDVSHEADTDAAVRRHAAEELARPFDLERDVLLRALLVRVGKDEHALLMKLHHITSDDWSRRVLLKEVGALYAAFVKDEPNPLPPITYQYADYAADQRARLRGPEWERQREYWKARLGGLRGTELPPDRPRPAALSSAAGRSDRPLEPDVVKHILELSRAEGVTPFMTLLAAFQALLGRHCSKTDVAVGVPVANRNRLEVESLIGFFVNTLVLRVDLSGEPTFRELVGRVRSVSLEAYEHQEFPFEQIVADLRPARDLSRNPIVQVLFNLVNLEEEPITMGDLEAVAGDWFDGQAKFDLTLYAWPYGPRPHLRLQYSKDLFEHERIAELLDQFVLLLREAVAEPDQPIGAYSLVTERARRLLPDPRAELDGPAPSDVVIRQFLNQADRSGSREALRWNGHAWSYADLSAVAADAARPAAEAVEGRLTRIWTEVLDLPHVDPGANFFELGGHSLLAARMILRVQRELGVEVPVRQVFDSPTIEGIAAYIRRSPQKVVPSAVADTAPVKPSETSSRPEALPLSFAQQRLWFLHALSPGSGAYHINRAFEVTGRLDEAALRSALTEIVRRHSALRTTFETVGGEPRQVVRHAVTFPLPTVDLASASPAERQDAVSRYTGHWLVEPFDLTRDLLVRSALLRMAEDRHILVLTLHHIAADGWSLDILARELREIYEASLRGSTRRLSELSQQYVDFVTWQRRQMEGKRFERLRRHWSRTLHGLPPLVLPTDHPRPPQMSYRGSRHTFTIAPALVGRLRELGRSEDATLFMTLLAAFQSVLGGWSGQTDFAIATPIAGRTRPEDERLIGFFANTMVIRADLSDDPSFRQLVGRVRLAALDAYEHGDMPFERLVSELAPSREMSRNPLVQVVCSLNAASEPFTLPGLDVRELPIEIQRSRFDLEMYFLELPDGGVRGSVVYATDLFDSASIERLAGQLTTALERASAEPEARISRLPARPVAEAPDLQATWNGTRTQYPRTSGLTALFAARVREAPAAVAIAEAGSALTYAELDARAERLAGHLADLGAGRGAMVGICLERGIDQVVATVAVVKAGAAYVPLDPADTPARLAFMLRDAGASAVVTSASIQDRLPADLIRVVDVGEALPEPERRELPLASGDDPAYVMYTSGSTGNPKGVVIPHRAVIRLVVNTNYVDLGPADVMAHASNPAFDAATFEIWGALLNGARLTVLGRDTLLAPSLGRTLRDEGITTIFLTTALFNHVAREMPDALAPVGTVLVGGEAVEPWAVRRVLAAGRPGRLMNAYGPTEATTFATTHLIVDCAAEATAVPIGRPIANTTAWVLDSTGQRAPIGVPGELCLGGDGLALGYLNQSALTAERFIRAAEVPGERLYRTGDRARWRADGVIEFLGRLDDQIKLRGHRIEPGEVETALTTAPAVNTCAVVATGEGTNKRLVAYVVPEPGSAVNTDVLARHLRARLPDYMVPASFIPIPNLPLTPNGKVDRRALATTSVPVRPQAGAPHRPLTDTETRLVDIWRNVLQAPRVGVDDDFFDLGGHSLLAVRLFAAIEDAFGVQLPLSELFEHRTVASLARVLDGSRRVSPWTPLVPIRPTGSDKPLFLVHGVGGEVLTFTNLALRLPPSLPVYGIQAAGPGSSCQMPSDIEGLAERYADEISSVERSGPYYVGGFSSGAVLALETAQALERRGKSVALLLLIDGGLPSSARRGRPIRHSPRTLVSQVANWIVDDALATSAEEWWPRASSKVRGLAARLRTKLGSGSGNGSLDDDIRHRLGIWKFPEKYRDLLRERFEAFERYVPRPFDGEIALIRSRTGRLFGPPQANLDAAWRALAARGFSVTYVRGSHSNILSEPRVGELARVIAGHIERARSSEGGTNWA